MRTAPLGVNDTAARTVLAQAAWGPSVLGGDTSPCCPAMHGVGLRVEHGQQAPVRACRSAFKAAVISALPGGL